MHATESHPHHPLTPEQDFMAIIPARYASTRFPGKPLALLGGKPIIERVYERVASVFSHTVVATDDERIFQTVVAFGGNVVMTSTNHRSGTDRCQEAYQKSSLKAKVIVNVQGDEPFIHPEQLLAIRSCFNDPKTDIATLAKPFRKEDGLQALLNPNSPKVVIGTQGRALYFSRSVIPYLRNAEQKDWLNLHTYYKHIGLYAYRAEALQKITSLAPSPLEIAESLEQLRWLENGLDIRVALTEQETIGIDTLDDLRRAEQYLQEHSSF